MRGRLVMAAAVVGAAACGGDGSGGTLGSLAFSDPSGDLVVLDVASGQRRIIEPAGAPGAIYLAPDRSAVAFSVEPQLFERHVYVADVDGDVREVQPQTGESMAGFRWLTGGYVRYSVYSGGVSSQWIAAPGATVARRIGEYEPYGPVSSPVEPRIAFSECEAPPLDVQCPRRLVVEHSSGADHVVLATGVGISPLAFTPDGRELITLESIEGATVLRVRAIDGSSVRELGAVQTVPFGFSNFSDDRNAISPDGTEVLAIRDDSLIAIGLADGQARVVADFRPYAAEFTSPGTVLYSREENLNPGSDVADYVYHLYFDDGVATTQLVDGGRCPVGPVVSRSGAMIAWVCDGHVLTIVLGDAIVMGDAGIAGHVLGIDDGDGVVIVATPKTGVGMNGYDIERRSLTGEAAWLAETPYQDTPGGYVEWPPFSYQP